MRSGLSARTPWVGPPAAVGGRVTLALATAAVGFVAAPADAALAATRPPGTHVVDGDTVPVVHHLGPTTFTSPGPFGVGETTLTLPTDGAPVEVWYPATQASVAGQTDGDLQRRQLAAAGAAEADSGRLLRHLPERRRRRRRRRARPFPARRLQPRLRRLPRPVDVPHLVPRLVGLRGGGAGPLQPRPDRGPGWPDRRHGQDDRRPRPRGDHRTHGSRERDRGSPFHGHVDTKKVGAVGHSAGGVAVEALAASRSKVATFIGLAGATVGLPGDAKHGPGSIVPHQPGLLMSGTADTVVPPPAWSRPTARCTRRSG